MNRRSQVVHLSRDTDALRHRTFTFVKGAFGPGQPGCTLLVDTLVLPDSARCDRSCLMLGCRR
jgi:hypothetical protein